ncbi:hypothetical protein WJT74_00200 [Sphingomicrobium sp. XHP0239]|uniref:hypothetical protein n=1 Tax=Sphingomicrobium maritimum TaxID=3133972 RepID=UPI0031CC88A5
MAYRKDNYDPNYPMGGEDMRKHRQLILMLVPIFLVMNMMSIFRDDERDVAQWAIEIITAIYILLVSGVLTGWWYSIWAGDAKPVLEDELTAVNRASSLKWGFTATVLAALALFLLDPLVQVFDVRSATMLILFIALTVTTARFVWLDRDEELAEE